MQTNNGPLDKQETMCMGRGGQRRKRTRLKRKRRDADSSGIEEHHGNRVRRRVVCSSRRDAPAETGGIVDAIAWVPKLRMES
jgi:hypothetical protein